MTTPLSVSQNFITSSSLVQKLINLSSITSQDTVYDIGAGKGIISSELAKVAKKVVAVEFDYALSQELKQKFSDSLVVNVINEDFLKLPLPKEEYKVFANIPFSLTSQIINKLVFCPNPPRQACLVVQKEAANKYMGVGEGYLTAALLKPFFDLSIVYTFKKSDFDPIPSVDIVLLKINKKDLQSVSKEDSTSYRDFVCYALLQQKPTLRQRLSSLFTSYQFQRICSDLGLSVEIAAKDINADLWINLFEKYKVLVDVSKKQIATGAFDSYQRALKNHKADHRTKIRK